jgi:hypothetical protein
MYFCSESRVDGERTKGKNLLLLDLPFRFRVSYRESAEKKKLQLLGLAHGIRNSGMERKGKSKVNPKKFTEVERDGCH